MRRPLAQPRPPYTIWAFAIVVGLVLIQVFLDNGAGLWLLGALLLVLATLGLVYGQWSAWAFLTLVTAGDVLVTLVSRPTFLWSVVLVNGTLFALLLTPSTRRWVRRGAALGA